MPKLEEPFHRTERKSISWLNYTPPLLRKIGFVDVSPTWKTTRVKREEDIHIYTRTYDSIQLESFYTARNKSLFPFNRERHRENERSGLREGRRRGERRSHRYNPARVCTCFTSTPRLFADSKLCRTIRVPLSRSRIIKRGKGKTCLARCSFFPPLSVSLCSTSASPPPFPSRRGVLDSSPNANVTSHLEISSVFSLLLFAGRGWKTRSRNTKS